MELRFVSLARSLFAKVEQLWRGALNRREGRGGHVPGNDSSGKTY